MESLAGIDMLQCLIFLQLKSLRITCVIPCYVMKLLALMPYPSNSCVRPQIQPYKWLESEAFNKYKSLTQGLQQWSCLVSLPLLVQAEIFQQ